MLTSIYLDGDKIWRGVRIGGKTNMLLFLGVGYLAHGGSSTWYDSGGCSDGTL